MVLSKKKIVFLQAAHAFDDDRVFYHQKKSLENMGCNVDIISSYSDFCFKPTDGAKLPKSKLLHLIKEKISALSPDVVICDTPIAVIAAKRSRNKRSDFLIIYDVTEWYPSKKNLRSMNIFHKIFKAFAMCFLSVVAAFYCDKFIFGEYYKSLLFRYLCFWKPFFYLCYFPNLKYFDLPREKKVFDTWTFMYCGNLTKEKGYARALSLVENIAKKYVKKNFVFKVVGNKTNEVFIEPDLQNLKIEHFDYMDFMKFCKFISNADIFIDLRDNDFENTRCLPIKLFYYAAVGKPSIFSSLKAIYKEIVDSNNFLQMENPYNEISVFNAADRYISNKDFYLSQCSMARKAVELKYNWTCVENNFLKYILDDRI